MCCALFAQILTAYYLQSVLCSQYLMLSFLPLTHPQPYLPMLFRMWESMNSYAYDDQMLQSLSWLAEMHTDPAVCDPRAITKIPDDERSEGEGRPSWSSTDDIAENSNWPGIYKDVGIFSEHEWKLLMCKCLASMGALGSIREREDLDSPFLQKFHWQMPDL
jgi:proteasome activator subunit 4